MVSGNGRPFRVLTLDGGGMRGVYTAAYLDRLTKTFAAVRKTSPLDFGKAFDLISGTSTGAIVGCALAVGIPMEKVVDLYSLHGRYIFPHRITGILSSIYRAFRFSAFVRAGDAALRSALTEILGNTTILEVFEKRGIALSIPTVDMSQHRAWVFKKTANSGVRDDNYPLVDVCMASSAAPIYRSLALVSDPNGAKVPHVFADGGLWANNPVLVALIDALLSAPKECPIEIYSLGTCSRPEGETFLPDKVHRGMFGWWLGAKIAPLSISAQEFAYDNMARLLANVLTAHGRPVSYVRFPATKVPADMLKYLALDDARPRSLDAMIGQARNDADMTKSACDDPSDARGQQIKNLMMSVQPRTSDQ